MSFISQITESVYVAKMQMERSCFGRATAKTKTDFYYFWTYGRLHDKLLHKYG